MEYIEVIDAVLLDEEQVRHVSQRHKAELVGARELWSQREQFELFERMEYGELTIGSAIGSLLGTKAGIANG